MWNLEKKAHIGWIRDNKKSLTSFSSPVECFLHAQQNLTFMSHRVHNRSEEVEGGNLLSVIKLLTNYDSVLKDLI